MKEFRLIAKKENPLFNRKEIIFEISSDITPSRAEIGKFVLEKFSARPETVKIKKISGKFGSKTFNVDVLIYGSEEDKNKTELKKKKDNLHIFKKEVADKNENNKKNQVDKNAEPKSSDSDKK